MATNGNQIRETMLAGADLSAKQFSFVTQNSTDRTVVTTGAGAESDGVVINNPLSGNAATVVSNGRVMINVGTGGLTAGDSIASDASGHAVAATTGNIILGKALYTAAAGTITTVDFFRGGNAA